MGTSGWASHRTPWWIFAVIAVLIGGAVVVSLSQSPSQAQRAGDLRGYFRDVNAGVESCAGGLRDAQTAVRKVTSGDRAEYQTAVGILAYNAQNCSPANNQSLQDFTNYQVPQSLATLGLDEADNSVITWAFEAQKAQNAMTAVLKANAPAARASAEAALTSAMATLDAQRARIYAIWHRAQRVTGDTSALPGLPT